MSEIKARNPKQKPCPDDFEYYDKWILCYYDAQDWFDSGRKFKKAVFNIDCPPEQYELNIIAEQQAHWDFYKKMRDDYWEDKRKYDESNIISTGVGVLSYRDIETGYDCRCQGRGPCQCD
jgi:hypothetical protein